MITTKNATADGTLVTPNDKLSDWLGVGELVITRIKNRWGLECAGTVEARHGDTADVRVWNMNGPGADMLVTGIPLDELVQPVQ
jgi:hypothetical protein